MSPSYWRALARCYGFTFQVGQGLKNGLPSTRVAGVATWHRFMIVRGKKDKPGSRLHLSFVINTQYFKIQKILKELGVSMGANTCNHRTWKARQDCPEFKTSVGYIVPFKLGLE